MATREEARQKREARLDELHETLTGAVEQLITGEDWADDRRFDAVLLDAPCTATGTIATSGADRMPPS